VADLTAFDALAALFPVETGGYRLEPAPQGTLTGLAPFAAPGGALPAPGRAMPHAGGTLLWAGHGQWLATGTLSAKLTEAAALTDQTDAWAVLRLTGPAPGAVLARLVPVDLRRLCFVPGTVARTLLGHIAVLIHRPEAAPEALELWLPRSMAAHAVREIAHAMRGQAARAAL
jgi:sarcosine oxidase subunit gamma